MWHMHDVGAGWWFLGTLGMIAFWGLIIWGVVAIVRSTSGGRRADDDAAAAAAQTPQEILERRLARGEITPEEYQRLRDILHDHGADAKPTAHVT